MQTEKIQAVQGVVDRVGSYQEGAPERTVEQELRDGFADAGLDLTDDEVTRLAAAIDEAAGCDRRAVRRHAVRRLSAERMVAEYEQVYASLAHGEVAA